MEQQVKKRTWVKDVAIIFLAVMLVLTFFSNTILNRSLPEAATAIVEPASIDSKVRVSGTVNAKENYDVILDQSRKVASVSVKLGQEVAAGDLLFTLEPGDSEELESAKDALHALELQYQKAVVSADNNDYAREKRNIELAQAEVDRAQAKYDKYALSDEALTALEEDIETAQSDVAALQKQVDEAQTGMSNSSDGSYIGGSTTAQQNRVDAAQNALNNADNARRAAHLAYDADYSLFEAEVKAKIAADYDAAHPEAPFSTLNEAMQARQYKSSLPYYSEKEAAALDKDDAKRIAYEKLTAAEAAYTAAQEALADARAALEDAENSASYDSGSTYQGKSHSYWVKQYNNLKPQLADAQAALEKLKTQKTNSEETLAALDQAEEHLRSLKDALEDAQRGDRLDAIDRQELQHQISEAKLDIEKLSTADTKTEVTARVNGTVQSLAVSAGHTATAGEVLATIEVPDLGYTMTATVTNEQARLLHVGDTAAVSNFYWGSSTTAEITAIRPDPKNPQNGKMLMFDITGDVTAGSTLNFSIGEKNATYDLVVPNSAVRSDTNGSFVLIITAKNSPLGNRYYATRVDVEVLASDDLNSAVKGALEGYDTVITATSNNAPLKNGDQVRLPDVN